MAPEHPSPSCGRLQAFTQIRHQPLGLIAPSTLLQALGAWNSLQLAQFWLPFGEP
jgi:hypothetical protein